MRFYYSFMENILHKMSISLQFLNQGRVYASPVIPPPTLIYVISFQNVWSIDCMFFCCCCDLTIFFFAVNSLLPWDFSLRVAKHIWVLNMTQTILVKLCRWSKVFVAQFVTVRAKRIWQISEILFLRLPRKEMSIY